MENQKNEEIVVSSFLRKEDFVKANKIIHKMRKSRYMLIAYIITFIIILILVRIFNDDSQNNIIVQKEPIADVPGLLTFLPTIIVMLFVVICIISYYIAKKVLPRRHYDSNKSLHQEYKYVFNNDGIQCSSERATVKLLWNEVFKVYISKDYLIIFLSNMTAWIIPKIHIGNDQINDFEKMIKANIPKKKVRIL